MHTHWGRLVAAVIVTLGLVAPVTALPAAGGQGTLRRDDDAPARLHLVVLRDPPLAAYTGGVAGFPATAPRDGERFDAGRASVAAYRGLLLAEQARVRRAVGDVEATYSYTTALNGFAARLTTQQAADMRAVPQVLDVAVSRKHRLTGERSGPVEAQTAAALGNLRTPGGYRPAVAGRGAVVGVVDSGIWPANPSFAAVPSTAAARSRRYPGFTGSCDRAERWSAQSCNAKIVSADYFVRGFGRRSVAGSEYLSPRDGSGHGSHVAAIAAGNSGVAVRIDGEDFGTTHGEAPGAALAVYKACWVAPDPADDGCTTADIVKAIDRAVSDGVDVLSYSVAGGGDLAVELALLNASAAGVFVAAAAGDGGPRRGSVGHPSPWVTTVAASSKGVYRGHVVLGDGRRIAGTMATNRRVRPAPLVVAENVATDSAPQRRAGACFPGALEATLVDDSVVLCERGGVARVVKSQAVEQAGGAGMVLVNNRGGSTYADIHSVPTVHVGSSDSTRIWRYLAREAEPTVALVPRADGRDAGSVIAAFSGRGPGSDPDVLKPDVAADGVNVLAAVAPPSGFGRLWDLYSGTSMSTPAVAGTAATLAARHPDWSPAAVKSAVVTTATAVPGQGGPLVQGAGVAHPRRALDPGLVYDEGPAAWAGYLRSRGVSYGVSPTGDQRTEVPGAHLNLPSIALGSLIGRAQVIRTVTNVSDRAETYRARVDGVRGVEVAVAPDEFTLGPGRSADFTVTFTARRHARYERFVAGTLTWRGSRGHRVTSPVVVRPQYLRAPDEATANTGDRSTDVTVRAGVTGTLHPLLTGLVGAEPGRLTVLPADFDLDAPAVTAESMAESFTVPPGAAVARFELRVDDAGHGVDLVVHRNGRRVASSPTGGGQHRAQLTLVRPRAGRYDVYAVASTDRDAFARAELTGWVVPRQRRDNARVTPRPLTVTGSRRADATISWEAVDASKRWFGYLSFAESRERTYLTLN